MSHCPNSRLICSDLIHISGNANRMNRSTSGLDRLYVQNISRAQLHNGVLDT